ncbi:hypothetical protein CRG98_036817 [Punica granatum]|uniref:Uncharacterized protein n=1 Tax=Punica granatum TaxID=22663 RepID=A0A2I0IFL8_PUNGR|nr:hypothetical protein CRG98_036817 [Punica granatum]
MATTMVADMDWGRWSNGSSRASLEERPTPETKGIGERMVGEERGGESRSRKRLKKRLNRPRISWNSISKNILNSILIALILSNFWDGGGSLRRDHRQLLVLPMSKGNVGSAMYLDRSQPSVFKRDGSRHHMFKVVGILGP